MLDPLDFDERAFRLQQLYDCARAAFEDWLPN